MKKIIKNTSMVLFAVMTLALIAAGCSKKSGSTDEDGELNNATKLVIGQNSNYFPIIVAYEKGFFKDEFGDTFKVEIPLFYNGPAQNEAFKAGQIDMASMGDFSTIQNWANYVDVQVISYLYDAPDAYTLVANKQSGIKTLADLKGKKIATMLGTNFHKFVIKSINSQGLDTNDVEIVNLQKLESIIALKQGIVDAASLDEPFLSQALSDDNNFKIGSAGNTVVTFVRSEYAKKNPQIVSRYLKVIKKTNDWIAQNVDEAIRIVMEFMGSDDLAATRKYYEARIWLVAADQALIDLLNDTIKFCREQEMITRDDLDAKNLVNDIYVKEAGL